MDSGWDKYYGEGDFDASEYKLGIDYPEPTPEQIEEWDMWAAENNAHLDNAEIERTRGLKEIAEVMENAV